MSDGESHGGRWIEETGEEWEEVLYELELSLEAEEKIIELSVWKIDSALKEKTAKHTVRCWVATESLDGENSLLDVCRRRGFVVNQGELLRFCQGSFSVGQNYARGQGQHSILHEYLLCDVEVGRSYVIEDESEPICGIPQAYDSLYLAYESDERTNHRVYAVPQNDDNSAITPLYVARFHIVPTGHETSDKSLNKEQISRHDRKEFFDPVNFRAVSVNDKMQGDYSTGPLAAFKLIPIEDAFDTAQADRRSLSSQVDERLESVKQQLYNIDDQFRNVHQNHAIVEEKIYFTLQNALKELEQFTKSKLDSILSKELELRRERGRLDSIAARFALDQNKNNLSIEDRAALVRTWATHRSMTKKYIQSTSIEDISAADFGQKLDLYGSIEVSAARQNAIECDHNTIAHEPPHTPVLPLRVPDLNENQRVDDSVKLHFKNALEHRTPR